MTRHLADRPRLRGPSRIGAFLDQDRKSAPGPAVLKLLSRPKDRDGATRASRYLDIARGREA
ncbi:hypothetical protein D3P06_15060 [Paracoccus aestuarii]|uniref:Uncharacterized protein n=1 Tax=Paracoccus aestuarii TaxID=453842 RepID=A0A418ZRB1_9RHOB|nr:hypothetical protein [Paracoccus aestuarii]RJK98988.1 hypothetical protein D3P06_15060 [Paracoccus aestuarii]WCQ99475.1 hypothetical protein JHW48_01610 [Paracoccus aestuarii]